MAHEYLLEIILVVKHGVKHGHNAAAGVSEYGVYPFVDKRLHESF